MKNNAEEFVLANEWYFNAFFLIDKNLQFKIELF